VSLTEIDRELLENCLARKAHGWEAFVDRFLGLVGYVVDHTAQSRSVRLPRVDRDDIISEVFVTLLDDDFQVLRRFRGKSSLATYLTVISRRVAVREMLRRPLSRYVVSQDDRREEPAEDSNEESNAVEMRDEVERMLASLEGLEADLVRMHYLDGMSYEEIAAASGLAKNSIGPTLSRARAHLRKMASRKRALPTTHQA
jgi:RNA polymerase sigma-70 factor (ECF subfamily)